MLKKVGAVLLAAYTVLLVVVATRPTNYQIERSIVIAAPPELVLAYVRNFQQWGQWSPWIANGFERELHGMDPALMAHGTTVSVAGKVGGDTTLTWRRSGTHGFGKALFLFMGTDWMIGKEFETGLMDIKRLAESEAKKQAEAAPKP